MPGIIDYLKHLVKRDITWLKVMARTKTATSPLEIYRLTEMRYPYVAQRVKEALEERTKPVLGHLYEFVKMLGGSTEDVLEWLEKAYRYFLLASRYEQNKTALSPYEINEMMYLYKELKSTTPMSLKFFLEHFPFFHRDALLRGLAWEAFLLKLIAERIRQWLRDKAGTVVNVTPVGLLMFLEKLPDIVRSIQQEFSKEGKTVSPVTALAGYLIVTGIARDEKAARDLAATLLFLREVFWGRLLTAAELYADPEVRNAVHVVLGNELFRQVETLISKLAKYSLRDVYFKAPKHAPTKQQEGQQQQQFKSIEFPF